MMGDHLVKHWSSTQKVVTLSSGEAELAGIVKGAAEALGLRSIAADLGIPVEVRIFADSSAAIGICKRTGICEYAIWLWGNCGFKIAFETVTSGYLRSWARRIQQTC